jgi:hypothetical protein
MKLYYSLLVIVGSDMQRRLGDIIFSVDACALGNRVPADERRYTKGIKRIQGIKPQKLIARRLF